ncbi:MAG: Asp-tRNA(Asn)/Glu-tRNA(Gln) amidotransferase subunit GatA [Ignavibacteria bacterium]|nr:Asp-tRNA(Asn)/Glu-tRNA(Gln) amidotransferase subunit GatA [Ignavibacteria bacterium]
MIQYDNHRQKLALICSGQLSLQENVEFFLSNIKKQSNLNAFISVFEEQARKQASLVASKIAQGNAGKLAGMVVAVKDVLALEGEKLTCASAILANFTSIYTATAVQKLIDEDAVIIGKTNCDEFAMGSSNENSAFGAVKNPVNAEYVPGGSSGGSAVAVAAYMCDVALGTDTGGSIRQPASFCGVVGLKPTYSRVSRYGLTAFASSFDTIGPFARSIDDVAAVMEVIAGYDDRDATSSKIAVENYITELSLTSDVLRIGVPKEYFGEGLQPEVRSAITSILDKLREAGHQIQEVSLPSTRNAIATYYILTMAEVSSNLERFDGARYGERAENSANLNDMYCNSRTEKLGKEVKRRILLGTYVLSAGYYDAYYRKAQQVRRLIKEDFSRVFSQVDVLVTPTAPTTAFRIGEKSTDPLEMYLSDIYTTSANLAGIPGMSIPVGSDNNGLPIGLQIMANEFQELELLKLGSVIEKIMR